MNTSTTSTAHADTPRFLQLDGFDLDIAIAASQRPLLATVTDLEAATSETPLHDAVLPLRARYLGGLDRCEIPITTGTLLAHMRRPVLQALTSPRTAEEQSLSARRAAGETERRVREARCWIDELGVHDPSIPTEARGELALVRARLRALPDAVLANQAVRARLVDEAIHGIDPARVRPIAEAANRRGARRQLVAEHDSRAIEHDERRARRLHALADAAEAEWLANGGRIEWGHSAPGRSGVTSFGAAGERAAAGRIEHVLGRPGHFSTPTLQLCRRDRRGWTVVREWDGHRWVSLHQAAGFLPSPC